MSKKLLIKLKAQLSNLKKKISLKVFIFFHILKILKKLKNINLLKELQFIVI